MRNWLDYLPKKENKNTLNRFEFTDEMLINEDKIIKKRFIFDEFKKYELSKKTYDYLKKNLDENLTFFIGSSWGWVEFFLSKSHTLIASDINEKYINFHKTTKDFQYIKFDILNISNVKKFQNKFSQLVVNNIEYLFDEGQLQSLIENLHLITTKDAKIYIIFRSKDSLIIKFIDNYLLPIENKIKSIIKSFGKDKWYFTKNHHGFRRTEKEFITILEKNNFKIQSVYKDMFESEYNNLKIVRAFKLSKILSVVFFKSHPHLNIFCIKKG